jgi:hypothetical protein
MVSPFLFIPGVLGNVALKLRREFQERHPFVAKPLHIPLGAILFGNAPVDPAFVPWGVDVV